MQDFFLQPYHYLDFWVDPWAGCNMWRVTWEPGWRFFPGDRENPKNNFDRIRENKKKRTTKLYIIHDSKSIDFPAMFLQKTSHFTILILYTTHRAKLKKTATDKRTAEKHGCPHGNDRFEKGRFGKRNFPVLSGGLLAGWNFHPENWEKMKPFWRS